MTTSKKRTPALATGGGIRNPRWRYTNSVSTDIRKTFRRVRAEMAKEKVK